MMTKNPYQRRVKDVMSKHVVTVDLGDTVKEALALMVENRVSGLPVLNARRRCVGVVSATDLVDLARDVDDELSRLSGDTDIPSLWLEGELSECGMECRKVAELMSNTVAAVGPETPLAETAQEMLRQRVHRLPVLDEHRRLLGIVSTMDVLAAFVDGGT